MIWISIGAQGDLSPGMWEGLRLTEKCFKKYGWDAVYVFHTRDGVHGVGTLHYSGNAVDIGWPESRALRGEILEMLKRYLGDDYDVVEHKSHIHVEYDPK